MRGLPDDYADVVASRQGTGRAVLRSILDDAADHGSDPAQMLPGLLGSGPMAGLTPEQVALLLRHYRGGPRLPTPMAAPQQDALVHAALGAAPVVGNAFSADEARRAYAEMASAIRSGD